MARCRPILPSSVFRGQGAPERRTARRVELVGGGSTTMKSEKAIAASFEALEARMR
jgi:hypothetical protein